MTTVFIVSDHRDRIESHNERTPAHYPSAEKALDGILSGYHGEAGTRFILKVDLEVVAEYARPWSIVAKKKD